MQCLIGWIGVWFSLIQEILVLVKTISIISLVFFVIIILGKEFNLKTKIIQIKYNFKYYVLLIFLNFPLFIEVSSSTKNSDTISILTWVISFREAPQIVMSEYPPGYLALLSPYFEYLSHEYSMVVPNEINIKIFTLFFYFLFSFTCIQTIRKDFIFKKYLLILYISSPVIFFINIWILSLHSMAICLIMTINLFNILDKFINTDNDSLKNNGILLSMQIVTITSILLFSPYLLIYLLPLIIIFFIYKENLIRFLITPGNLIKLSILVLFVFSFSFSIINFLTGVYSHIILGEEFFYSKVKKSLESLIFDLFIPDTKVSESVVYLLLVLVISIFLRKNKVIIEKFTKMAYVYGAIYLVSVGYLKIMEINVFAGRSYWILHALIISFIISTSLTFNYSRMNKIVYVPLLLITLIGNFVLSIYYL